MTVFVGHILTKLEEMGVLEKMKGGSFMIGGGSRIIEEKKVVEFSDDESSIASSVFTAKSVASSTVASSQIGHATAKVSMTSLEQGSLDKLLLFDLAVPVYEPFPKLLFVKNGAYFPVKLENPAVLEALKRKEESEQKKAAGLLLEDGSESLEHQR